MTLLVTAASHAKEVEIPGRIPNSLQRTPGSKLSGLACYLFDPKIYSWVFEPAIRDLQDEHAEAVAAGRPWLARYVQIRGYWSFWAAAGSQMPRSAIKLLKAVNGLSQASARVPIVKLMRNLSIIIVAMASFAPVVHSPEVSECVLFEEGVVWKAKGLNECPDACGGTTCVFQE